MERWNKMILIKGDWHEIRDLDDAIQLIREDYNYDLAYRIDELVNELNLDHNSDMSDLQEKCDMLEDECANKDDRISTLEDEVESLNEEVMELERQVDYWSGIVTGRD